MLPATKSDEFNIFRQYLLNQVSLLLQTVVGGLLMQRMDACGAGCSWRYAVLLLCTQLTLPRCSVRLQLQWRSCRVRVGAKNGQSA